MSKRPLSPSKPRHMALVFTRSPHRLHAMISGAGHETRCDPSYDWHGLKRGHAEFALLQHTLAGSGMLRCDGVERVVTAGQTMLLTFPQDNRYWLPPGQHWEFFWLALHGAEVMRAFTAANERLGPLVTLGPRSPVIASAVRICKAALDGRVRSPWQASSLAYELCMKLFDIAQPGETHHRSQPRTAAIERAVTMIDANPGKRVTVQALADASGYSRFHFARLFKASEGMSPEQFVIQRRLSLAAKMLRDSDQPLKVISPRCGFADVAYFCRAFRRSFGVSPGVFRDSGMYPAQKNLTIR